MGLGNSPDMIYLSISKDTGKIRCKDGDSEVHYDYMEGVLESVELRRESYQGSEFYKYYFMFRDGEQVLALQSSEGSSFSRSLLNSLCGLDDMGVVVRVTPYQKSYQERTYTVPYVTVGGASVSWAVAPEGIPDAERVQVGDKMVLDDKARREFFRKMAARVNARLESVEVDESGLGDTGGPAEAVYGGDSSDGGAGGGDSDGSGLPEIDDYDDELPF